MALSRFSLANDIDEAICPSTNPEPPYDMCCPITQEIMEDPVRCADGFTYERATIEEWLRIRRSSPMTNLPMTDQIETNISLRQRIEEFRTCSEEVPGVEFPKYWTPTQDSTTRTVSPDGNEGRRLLALFAKTLGRHSGGGVSVVRIERHQNPALWRSYADSRQAMAVRNRGSIRERYMFHGPATQEGMRGILESGVDPSYSNGGPCGHGSYFSNSSSYVLQAHKYLRVSESEKQVIIGRVLVGRTALGRKGMYSPPENYDSTWQHSIGGRVYCLFDKAQSYPEYTVTFIGSPAPAADSEDELPNSSTVRPWLQARGFTVLEPQTVENPLIEITESPNHACILLDTNAPGIVAGKHIDEEHNLTDDFVVWMEELDSDGEERKVLRRVPEANIKWDDAQPIETPWLDKGLLVSSDVACEPLRRFLSSNVEGMTDHLLNPVTFHQVFEHYRMYGVCLLFFGGAVRHALLNDFAGIKDGDCTFGACAKDMVRVGQSAFGPVSHREGLVVWGEGVRVMEGKSIRLSHSNSCHVIDGDTVCGISNNLHVNVIHADFACNSVLFDPTSNVFIDPTGFGIFDIHNHILRIPVSRLNWERWLKATPTKILRYWKMRQMGFTAEDEETHDFIIAGVVKWKLIEDIPEATRNAFIYHQICRGREVRVGARQWVLNALRDFRAIVVSDIDAFNAHNAEDLEIISGSEFWDRWLAPQSA